MNQNELNVTATCINALANQPNSEEKIKLLLTSLFTSYKKEGFFTEQENEKTISSVSAPLLFTSKELSKMPKTFNKEFKVNKLTAHVRLRDTGVYEIYCYVCGTQLWATSKNLAIAKDKFTSKLKAIENGIMKPAPKTKCRTDFCSYIDQWLETAKKPHVKENTYKDYVSTVNRNIKPIFKNLPLTKITYTELQAFITKYQDEGKNRTAKKIYQLLCGIFDAAVADRLIPISPMLKVKLTHYEPESGVPFTREEEKRLLDDFKRDPTLYRQAFVFMIYSGIRRSELASVNIKDNWIYVITAKQRKGFKEKIRAFPIPPMLNELLPMIHIEEIVKIDPHLLTKHLHKQFGNHHCHDLRHTFITRAQECGIRREYVSLWAGHKADSSITSNVYTHLEQNKELQIEEMKKFDYTL